MTTQTLNLNGELLASIPGIIELALLDAGLLPGDPAPRDIGVALKSSGAHVLVRVTLLPPHGYHLDRASKALEISRETGEWVYSELEAFEAGQTYAEYSRAAYARRRA